MSTQLRWPLRKLLVEAPPGIGGPDIRQDRLADGWEHANPSPWMRFKTSADVAVLKVTRFLASALTRREFMERGLKTVFVAAAGFSAMFWDPIGASGHEPLEPDCGPMSAGCGPSPLCSDGHCNNNGNCDLNDSAVRHRVNASIDHWEGYACGGPNTHNCWRQCCGTPSDCNEKRCCDCCTGSNDLPHCEGCGSTKHACICRSTSGSCAGSAC